MHQLPQRKLKGLESGPSNTEASKRFSQNEQENWSRTFIDNHLNVDVIIFNLYLYAYFSLNALSCIDLSCYEMYENVTNNE